MDKFLVWESEEALSGTGWALADLMTKQFFFSLTLVCVCGGGQGTFQSGGQMTAFENPFSSHHMSHCGRSQT